MKLTILGTGNAAVTECYNTCFAIQNKDEYFLIDTGGGNGILTQLEKAGIPIPKIHHIFISHAWKYNEGYYKIIEWLNDSAIKYSYRNYSVPEHDPFDNDTNLKIALTNQIKPANVVLILSGMYASYSKWIDYEIDEAIRMGKYIIGVMPWGQERIPSKIQNNANIMVGWNSNSIIDAIKNSQR